MRKALVSVIVPCYNCEKTVEKTVRSILMQTVSDLELIAVDDGSTDGTGALLDRLATEDARMQVIHQQNGGVARARNAGMAAANGKWLAFADADDFWMPFGIETLLALDTGKESLLCGGYTMRFADENRREAHLICADGSLQTVLESLIRGDSGLNPMYAKLYRSDLLKENGIWVPNGVKIGEDVLLNLEAFQAAPAWRMTNQAVYVYEFGGDSAMVRALSDVYAKSKPMLDGIGRFVCAHGLETALFRAHIDVYLRTLRRDRGRVAAAFAFSGEIVRRITKGVCFRDLPLKQKIYYLALRILPCSSYFLP